MPHIRLIENEECGGALYINGTNVLVDEYIDANQLIVILADNLGIDAKSYSFDNDALNDKLGAGPWPDKLRDFGELIDKEDRI